MPKKKRSKAPNKDQVDSFVDAVIGETQETQQEDVATPPPPPPEETPMDKLRKERDGYVAWKVKLDHEVKQLQAQLASVTKERNDLKESNAKLQKERDNYQAWYISMKEGGSPVDPTQAITDVIKEEPEKSSEESDDSKADSSTSASESKTKHSYQWRSSNNLGRSGQGWTPKSET